MDQTDDEPSPAPTDSGYDSLASSYTSTIDGDEQQLDDDPGNATPTEDNGAEVNVEVNVDMNTLDNDDDDDNVDMPPPPPRPAPTIQVTVKTLQGQVRVIEVSPDMEVRNFKRVVQERLNIRIDQQRLVFRSKELTDGYTLTKCGIGNGALLQLVNRQQGGS